MENTGQSFTSSIQNQTTSPTLPTMIDTPIPSSLKFLMTHIKTISTTPLSIDNYPLWQAQVLKLFTANGFHHFLDQTAPSQEQFLSIATGDLQANPHYTQWRLIDQNLSAALYSTISQSILSYILNLPTTAEIWQTLKRRLQSHNHSRVIQLKSELHHLTLKDKSMQQYLLEVKSIIDNISATGSTIDPEDIILYILNGLPPLYQPFKTSIRTQLNPINLEDFYALLINEETHLANEASHTPLNQPNHLTLYSNRGRSTRPPYRGRSNASRRGGLSYPSKNRFIICQICEKPGHSASKCWHRTNFNYQPTTSSTKALQT